MLRIKFKTFVFAVVVISLGLCLILLHGILNQSVVPVTRIKTSTVSSKIVPDNLQHLEKVYIPHHLHFQDYEQRCDKTNVHFPKINQTSIPIGNARTEMKIRICKNSKKIELKDNRFVYVKYGKATRNLSCCVHRISFDPKTKKPKNICTKIQDNALIKNPKNPASIFPHLTCNDTNVQSELYLSNFLLMEEAEFKREYWSTKKTKGQSILILGISSLTSHQFRIHYPKTHAFFIQNRYKLHHNYVKSGNGIVENVYPILSGMKLENCMNQSEGCELVFSKFNTLKYITMEGIQEFGYTSTKAQNAADYSLTALLKGYENGMMKKLGFCYGYTVLREYFSYVTRFLKTYYDIPYFIALWIDVFNIQWTDTNDKADDILAEFFNSNFKLLKDTTIIFLSDNGIPSVSTNIMNSIIESHYPAFFIKNSALTLPKEPFSAFEVHKLIQMELLNTCKVLRNENSYSDSDIEDICIKEEKYLSDEANSKETNWLCGVNILDKPLDNTLVTTAAFFVINIMNGYIYDKFSNKERILCSNWILDSIIYNSSLIRIDPNTRKKLQEIIIVFKAQPTMVNSSLQLLIATFMARIIVSKEKEMILVEFPLRIPGPGEFKQAYSECVTKKRDYKLSNICYCKENLGKVGHVEDSPLY